MLLKPVGRSLAQSSHHVLARLMTSLRNRLSCELDGVMGSASLVPALIR